MKSILRGLVNGQNTNLSKGTIRNADAVLLLLNEAGGVAKVGYLQEQLRNWRPGLTYGYLFRSNYEGGGYGFTGTSFLQSHNVVHHEPSYNEMCKDDDLEDEPTYGHNSIRRTYYYRSGRGIYAISAEGYKRLRELGIKGKGR